MLIRFNKKKDIEKRREDHLRIYLHLLFQSKPRNIKKLKAFWFRQLKHLGKELKALSKVQLLMFSIKYVIFLLLHINFINSPSKTNNKNNKKLAFINRRNLIRCTDF